MPEPVQDSTLASAPLTAPTAAVSDKHDLSFTAYEHVKSYPIVSESISYVTDVPYVSDVKGYADNYVSSAITYISSVSILVSLINTADKYAENGLTSLDNSVPAVKTVSFSSANSYATELYNSILERINKNINSIYHSTDGLRSSVSKNLQPVLKITNDYFETLLDFVLPVKEKIESEATEVIESSENEIDRLYKLVKDTAERLQALVSSVSSIPTHCRTIYSDEKSKGSAASVALANTSRRLSTEAYDSLKPTINKIIGSTKEVNGYVDQQFEKVSKSVDGAVNTVLNAAEHAAGYGDHTEPTVATSTGVEINETS